jgi:hypothetical protein
MQTRIPVTVGGIVTEHVAVCAPLVTVTVWVVDVLADPGYVVANVEPEPLVGVPPGADHV